MHSFDNKSSHKEAQSQIMDLDNKMAFDVATDLELNTDIEDGPFRPAADNAPDKDVQDDVISTIYAPS